MSDIHPITEKVNKKQKNKSKQAKMDALTWLAKTFPAAFDNSNKILPLKIGIIDDILSYEEDINAKGISKSKLRQAVAIYTRRIDYLVCLKAKEFRVDLQGNPISAVTEEEAQKAALRLKKHIEYNKSSREQESLIVEEPVMKSKSFYVSSQSLYQDINEDSEQSNVMASKGPSIKHKAKRNFDPELVARLKEKLGIIQKDSRQD